MARGGPRRGIGGGPVHHAGLNKRERLAGPSVPSFATPYSWFDLTPRLSQRAERRRTMRLISMGLAECDPKWRRLDAQDHELLLGPNCPWRSPDIAVRSPNS